LLLQERKGAKKPPRSSVASLSRAEETGWEKGAFNKKVNSEITPEFASSSVGRERKDVHRSTGSPLNCAIGSRQ